MCEDASLCVVLGPFVAGASLSVAIGICGHADHAPSARVFFGKPWELGLVVIVVIVDSN